MNGLQIGDENRNRVPRTAAKPAFQRPVPANGACSNDAKFCRSVWANHQAMTQLGLAITFLTTAILVIGFFAIGKGGWPSKVWWETRHAVKAELPTNSTSTIRVTETGCANHRIRLPKQCARNNGTQQVRGLWEIHPVLDGVASKRRLQYFCSQLYVFFSEN